MSPLASNCFKEASKMHYDELNPADVEGKTVKELNHTALRSNDYGDSWGVWVHSILFTDGTEISFYTRPVGYGEKATHIILAREE
jgi:hypothetical protein